VYKDPTLVAVLRDLYPKYSKIADPTDRQKTSHNKTVAVDITFDCPSTISTRTKSSAQKKKKRKRKVIPKAGPQSWYQSQNKNPRSNGQKETKTIKVKSKVNKGE
jgi:hypothetical protein